MITDGKLDIFEAFELDRSLSRNAPKPRPVAGLIAGDDDEVRIVSNIVRPTTFGQRKRRPLRFLARLLDWWRARRVTKLFSGVKGATKILPPTPVPESYREAADAARANGQMALAEAYIDLVDEAECEQRMRQVGIDRYVDEADVVRLCSVAPRRLKLDWIWHFTRHIPEDVLATKKKADAAGCFASYAVLHYDPTNTGAALTKQDIARKKDPILFGLNPSSRRLYIIGDWIDEHCTLTVAEMARLIGRRPRQLDA